MTEQDKQALIKHFCSRDCGEEFAKECAIMPCHEIELIQEFPTTEALPPANNSENPNSSDTISRAKAIEALKDALIAWSYMPEWRDEKILEAIAELPSVEPERIKGRWKNKGKIRAWDVCGIETFGVKRECTNCGFVHIFIEDHGHYPYCPICRADME